MALFILGDNSTHRSTSLQITHSDVIIATGVYQGVECTQKVNCVYK